MNIFPFYDRDLGYDWETIWPLWYPAWTYRYGPFDGDHYQKRQLLTEPVQERANRRLKKKSMKAACAQGLKKRDRMPGAWPT